MNPRITLGIPDHPRTRAIIDGKVKVDGYDLDLTYNFSSSGERHQRFAQGEFDVGEYSAATFLRTREQGFRFLALPVFFERGPRQRCIFHCEGKLNHPSELKGKKIGCFRYGATAVVWARGFLLDEYGVKTTDMEYYISGREVHLGQELSVKVERLDPPPPFGQEKEHLSKLLSEGKLHAACVAGDMGHLGIFGGGTLAGAMGIFPGVKPLFSDTEEIIRYIKKNRIYPIIHLIALKEEIVERHPDFSVKLLEAFREAKKLSTGYLSPEVNAGLEKEKEVLGEDPYAYVLGETEKKSIKTLIRYQLEQGTMKKELPLESLFVPQTLN